MSITTEQCRAARALLNWSQDRLVKASGVSKATIANFELGKRVPYERTREDIEGAFVHAGIVFLTEGENINGGAGVRLRSLVSR